MRIVFSYIFTTLYFVIFASWLGLFHYIQVLSLKFGGYKAHKKSVDILNGFLAKSMMVMGVRSTYKGFDQLPMDRPLIIVSNHQSSMDIPPIGWRFRKHHVKFIAKIELGKGLPSISFNLRMGGSALIDRSNGSQSIKEIIKLGRYIEANKYSVCIFPEGTRSKDGKLKEFQAGGLKTLMKASPSALLVPFVTKGHSLLQEKGIFPMRFGTRTSYTVLAPIEQNKRPAEELIEECHKAIFNELEKPV